MLHITSSQAKKLPKLYATEREALKDKIAHVKFFLPSSDWVWYVIEFDGDDTCWGLVNGHEAEFGYFLLSQLRKVSYLGTGIESDIFFRPTRVAELAAFGKGGVVV